MIVRARSGIYEADFRFKGHPRLHLSLGCRWRAPDGEKPWTKKEAEAAEKIAQARHDAVEKLFRMNRRDMIAQLTLPKGHPQRLTPERLAHMVEHHEPLVPLPAPAEDVTDAAAPASAWGTVREVGERYLDWLKAHPRKAAGTHATAQAQIRRFCRFVVDGTPIGDRPLDAVTTPMIEAYQQHLVATAKPNTITAYMIRVGALWTWAGKREELAARQAKRAAAPLYSPVVADELYRKTTARDRYLTPEEGDRLIAETPRPLLAIVGLGLFAGLRLEEALYLRPRDVDTDLGLLSITEKRLPDGTDWAPKTKRSTRDLPIAPTLLPILERQLRRLPAGAPWLTPRPHDGDSPWHPRVFQEHFTAIVRRAGMTPGRTEATGVTFHTLRHTFASHLVMQGVDLFTVSKLLGDTPDTVERTYAHLSPDYKKAAVAKLGSVFTIPVFSDTGSDTE